MPTQETVGSFVSTMARDAGVDGVAPDDRLVDRGVIDSMGMLELLEWLEQRFDVRIRDEEVVPGNFATVRSIARFVDEKREAAGDAP